MMTRTLALSLLLCAPALAQETPATPAPKPAPTAPTVVEMRMLKAQLSDAVRITPVASPIELVETGDGGYEETAGTWTDGTVFGFEYRVSGDAGATATYSFGEVTAGWQEVLVRFPNDKGHTDRAVYTVLSGGVVIAQVPIDQRVRIKEPQRRIETVLVREVNVRRPRGVGEPVLVAPSLAFGDRLRIPQVPLADVASGIIENGGRAF